MTVCDCPIPAGQAVSIGCGNRRIIESLRLEKTSKIIKPNRQPNTTLPTKPYHAVPHLHVFWAGCGFTSLAGWAGRYFGPKKKSPLPMN